MITYEEALTARHFEHVKLANADKSPLRARRNGQTKVWKTRPGEFQIPIKHGLYSYGYITHDNATDWRVA